MEKFLNGLTDAGAGLIRVLINITVGFATRALRKRYRWFLLLFIVLTFTVPAIFLYSGYHAYAIYDSEKYLAKDFLAEQTALAALSFLILLAWTGFYSLRVVVLIGAANQVGKIPQVASKLFFGKAPAAQPAGKKK